MCLLAAFHWGLVITVGLALSFCTAWWALILRRRFLLRRVQNEHKNRSQISDDHFVQDCGIDDVASRRALQALAVRRTIASLIGVAPETIYPSDDLRELPIFRHVDVFEFLDALYAEGEIATGEDQINKYWIPRFNRLPQRYSVNQLISDVLSHCCSGKGGEEKGIRRGKGDKSN